MLTFNDKIAKTFIDEEKLLAMQPEIDAAMEKIVNRSGEGNQYTGWVDLPLCYDRDEFARIKADAAKIRKMCDIFVVIGIGGSYLGARAAIEFVKSPNYNAARTDTPAIYFVGNNISSAALKDVYDLCQEKDFCVNVISKSGTTTEPAIAFRFFKELLEKKYGTEGARERIFATTGLNDANSALNKLSLDEKYARYSVPDDIGGRYSVLTAVGLLPIAVAGIDITSMMLGAAAARAKCLGRSDLTKSPCALRNLLYREGKSVEILASYEPSFAMMAEWWKQLYGESEGKDGKGILPDSVVNTTDLHSLGQIIQQGQRNIFETHVFIYQKDADIRVGHDDANLDQLNYLEGKSLYEINETAFEATVLAHTDGGVPCLIMELDGHSAADFGYMVYFFEMACALSGYTLGINPFNQPGVEDYKKNMFAFLGKENVYADAQDSKGRKPMRRRRPNTKPSA